MTKRKCKNWLKTLAGYVEETESAREFWLWSGIFALCASMQRKVWLPFGLKPLFPNMYILLVAAPGKARKDLPITVVKEMLEAVKVPVSVDSMSKRALTKELAAASTLGTFEYRGKTEMQTSLAIISKELSSLLAIDPKGMIEVLTDLYATHDTWTYKTSGEGTDALCNLCVNCFLGSTPKWIAENLPEIAMGAGFSSRIAMIMGYDKYRRITLPPTPPKEMYEKLIYDLGIISTLVGEFKWKDGLEGEAYLLYDKWYQALDNKYTEVKDDRLHPFLERIHVMVLKVAMALRVAYSDDLTLVTDDIGRAIDLLERVLDTASDALAGQGRSRTSIDVERILTQVRLAGETSFRELLTYNHRHTNKAELQEVLDTVVAMGVVVVTEYKDENTFYKWKEKKGGKK